MPSRVSIWIALFIGSTIGGIIPELWGAEMLPYTSLILSGVRTAARRAPASANG
jgi:predicted MFS family arabinose efflux permease